MSEATTQQTQASAPTTTTEPPKTEATAAPTEGKTTDAKTETTETKTEAKTETKVIPEKYVLTAKDGFQLSQVDVQYIENYAREQKLSQEEAQAVMDQQVDFMKRQMKALDDSLSAALQADPEIGGDKLQATIQNTKKVLERFDKEGTLAAKLDKYGISKDPELMRFFSRVGAQLKDDTHVSAHGGTSGQVKPIAQRLYGDTMNA